MNHIYLLCIPLLQVYHESYLFVVYSFAPGISRIFSICCVFLCSRYIKNLLYLLCIPLLQVYQESSVFVCIPLLQVYHESSLFVVYSFAPGISRIFSICCVFLCSRYIKNLLYLLCIPLLQVYHESSLFVCIPLLQVYQESSLFVVYSFVPGISRIFSICCVFLCSRYIKNLLYLSVFLCSRYIMNLLYLLCIPLLQVYQESSLFVVYSFAPGIS